jgi:peptidoglycan biosynthesis protein MviN/MurJ (putative lipid II flippase)
MGYVKMMAMISAVEAALNLCLSVALVKFFNMGIYGIAVGTAVPCLVMTGLVLLIQACRRTGVGAPFFLQATTLRWVLASGLLLPLGWLICHYVHEAGWGMFWVRACLMVLCYLPIGLLLVLGPAQSRNVLSRLNVFSAARRARTVEETRL